VTLFEYLAIAFGLVYSVAALRLLGGLPFAVAASRRYWVHLSLTLFQLLVIAASFWSFWSLQETEWTFPRFLLALAVPALIYYCSAVLVPENPEEVQSWHAHYFTVRQRFFAGIGLWAVAGATNASVNAGMPLTHPSRLIHLAVLLVSLVAAFSARPAVHAAIASLLGVVFLVWVLLFGFTPDWMAR